MRVSSPSGRIRLPKIKVFLFFQVVVVFSATVLYLHSIHSLFLRQATLRAEGPPWATEEESQPSLIHIPIESFQDRPQFILPVPLRRFEMFKWKHLRDVGDKALLEYGNELRNLLSNSGREFLDRNDGNRALHDTERARHFRQRLKAMAPWLRGDPTKSDWPLSQLPIPAVGEEALVVSAGANQLGFLKTLLYTVRFLHGSNIAVNVVFRDEADLPNEARSELLDFLGNHTSRLSFVDLSTKFDVARAQLSGWNLKALGIMAVPETKIALLDVDVLLLQAPEKLFQLDGFQRTGALFFLDRSSPETLWTPRSFVCKLQPHLSPMAQKVLKRNEFFTEYVQEAGVVLIDKERRALGVWAINLLLGRPDVRRYAQRDLVYGDKEMYFSAFETISEPYEFSRHYPGAIGSILTDFKGNTEIAHFDAPVATASGMALCGRLLHFDDDGTPLWWNGGYLTKGDFAWTGSSASSKGLQPVFYLHGGDLATEDRPLGMKRKWRFNMHMAVECLFPSAQRKIHRVPSEQATAALKAVQMYTEVSQ